jgi:hypothetical protein
MPKSYPDVTRSGAASAEVQEEGRKPTTLASPELAPQLSPNSNINFGRASLDLRFSSSCFGSEEWASIYRGRRLGRVEDLPLFLWAKPTSLGRWALVNSALYDTGGGGRKNQPKTRL